ncbi:MAG: hypothetical protein MJ202_00320 [Lentisphaeria bacterium]|nr:hypothetical protein [Lentisphaeria bacterium]
MKISADFNQPIGVMKPMHGVGQPPMVQLNDFMMHYLTEAGIPYSRLHDVQGPQGANAYVDIPNIFRNFEADVEDPASYDFAFTDAFLTKMIAHHVEPFFRLGVTIENCFYLKPLRIDPPKDFAKWARICEHIIRHYNHGWANGFQFGIKYWEIWNEPDDGCYDVKLSGMWKGTPEQFFDFYATAARHLKACFGDEIQVGGYGACGFWEYRKDLEANGLGRAPQTQREGYLEFAHRFLQFVHDENVPLDFFSWHSYADLKDTVEMARYCRRLLKKHGLADVPDFLDEWNTCFEAKRRGSDYAAAQVFGMMLAMQKEDTKMLNYYDARLGFSGYGGMFNPDTWEPYLAYFVFKMFHDAYQLKNEMQSASDDPDVYVCAAGNDRRRVLLLANVSDRKMDAELDLQGVSVSEAEVVMINSVYRNSLTGIRIASDGKLSIPPYTCVELRF